MTWFFRVVEQENGSWLCRHGLTEYDTHGALQHAVDHMIELANGQRPARIFLHRIDGNVEVLGDA